MLSEIDKRPYAHECGRTSFTICPACIYAEGRKAAEKEFKELWELANEAGYFNQDMMIWRMNYAAWKKARGIE